MTLRALTASVLIGLSAAAQAATIEFDVSDLTFSDALNGIAPYQLTGDTTFLFDTGTTAISGVALSSPETGAAYMSGNWTAGEITLAGAGAFRIKLDPFVDLAILDALAVGDSFSNAPSGDEGNGAGFFAFTTGSVKATRLADPMAVPLPASLLLVLGAFGALGVAAGRRR